MEEDRLWIQRSSVGMHLLVLALVPLLPLIIIPFGTRTTPAQRIPLGVGAAVMVGGWGLWWLRRVAVVAYPDHVVVRNIGGSHCLRRARVDGVEIGPSGSDERGTYVWIRARGGDLWRVDAMSTPLEGSRGMRVAAERSGSPPVRLTSAARVPRAVRLRTSVDVAVTLSVFRLKHRAPLGPPPNPRRVRMRIGGKSVPRR